eukprot:jgi/Ulvmu1/5995/UM026_0119.1
MSLQAKQTCSALPRAAVSRTSAFKTCLQARLCAVDRCCRRDCTARSWMGHDDAASALDIEGLQKLPPGFKYKRVMLKISGEALEGEHEFGIDPLVLKRISKEVAEASKVGVEIAIVVGGGNFFRGVNRWDGLDRPTADYVGMLATVMNAITLQSALESEGVEVRVQTAIEMREVAEPYIRRRAVRHLERGRVVIFGGGTGNPFFTTDTASALRAAEIGAEVYLKATQVDGIYDSDPHKNPTAKRYSHLSYRKCVVDDLKVLDESAFALCKENQIPVLVFDLGERGNILRAVMGAHAFGTVVNGDPDLPEDMLPDVNQHFVAGAARS